MEVYDLLRRAVAFRMPLARPLSETDFSIVREELGSCFHPVSEFRPCVSKTHTWILKVLQKMGFYPKNILWMDTWKPWETIIWKGISIPGFLRWCRILSIHGMFFGVLRSEAKPEDPQGEAPARFDGFPFAWFGSVWGEGLTMLA